MAAVDAYVRRPRPLIADAERGHDLPPERRRRAALGAVPAARCRAWCWLAVFFVVPLVTLCLLTTCRPRAGTPSAGYVQTFQLQQLHRRDLAVPATSSSARSCTPAIATVLALADRVPAGLHHRVQGGAVAQHPARARRRTVLLQLPHPHARVAARSSPTRAVTSSSRPSTSPTSGAARLTSDGRLLATPFAVIIGLTYNFLPFMTLPLYASLERIDPRLIEAAGDLYAHAVHRVPQGHLPAVDARRRRRHAADVHPGRR